MKDNNYYNVYQVESQECNLRFVHLYWRIAVVENGYLTCFTLSSDALPLSDDVSAFLYHNLFMAFFVLSLSAITMMDLGSHTFGTSLVGLGVFGDGAARGGVREIMARYTALME